MSDPDTNEAKLRECARAYAAALLAGDEVEAEVAIRAAMRARLTPAEINGEIITPALWLIGELWARDEISVGVEHVATEISMRILALQGEAQRTAQGRTRQRVLLAAAEGEQHVMALKMAANLLTGAGYTHRHARRGRAGRVARRGRRHAPGRRGLPERDDGRRDGQAADRDRRDARRRARAAGSCSAGAR